VGVKSVNCQSLVWKKLFNNENQKSFFFSLAYTNATLSTECTEPTLMKIYVIWNYQCNYTGANRSEQTRHQAGLHYLDTEM